MKDQDLERLLGLMDEVESYARNIRPPSGNENASTSTITVNAGGVWHAAAVWIASFCCVLSMLALVLGAVGVSHYISAQDDKLSRMQDYLNAIYTVAPQLRPKDS